MIVLEKHEHTWSREEARSFVSRASGWVAAFAGIGALIVLLFVKS